MAFPPLRNSDHVVVSVTIDFPLNSKAYDYSCADWDSLLSKRINLLNLNKVQKKLRKLAIVGCPDFWGISNSVLNKVNLLYLLY